MKRIAFTFLLVALGGVAQACPHCRPLVREGVYNASFTANLFALSLPLVVLLAIGIGLHHMESFSASKRGENKS